MRGLNDLNREHDEKLKTEPKTYLVTCGDCGVVMRIKRNRAVDVIRCRKCGFTSHECDFPDKNY